MSYEGEVLADSPVLYWRLGEASGPTASDATGNGRHGTYVGCTFETIGPFPEAGVGIELDGVDDCVSRADEAALDLGDTFSMEAWIHRPANGAVHGIMGKGDGAYLMRCHQDGYLQLLRSHQAVIVSSTILVPTTGWHHVVATKSGATSKLYIDETDRTDTVTDSTCVDNTTSFRVGADTSGSDTPSDFFAGYIDEVALYSTALSAVRVSAHFQASILLEQTGIWPFNRQGPF